MVCILVCSSLLGYYLSRLDGYRLKDLVAVKKMALMLATEIEYSATLAVAFEQISRRLEGVVANMMREVSESLARRNGEPFIDIWRSKLNRYENLTYLHKEDLEQISEFGKFLGHLDKSMQDKNIKIFIEYLDQEMGYIYEMKRKNEKMYQSLGVLLGLLVIIIML